MVNRYLDCTDALRQREVERRKPAHRSGEVTGQPWPVPVRELLTQHLEKLAACARSCASSVAVSRSCSGNRVDRLERTYLLLNVMGRLLRHLCLVSAIATLFGTYDLYGRGRSRHSLK